MKISEVLAMLKDDEMEIKDAIAFHLEGMREDGNRCFHNH